MSEIDLVPSDYRHVTRMRGWLRNFAIAYLVLVALIAAAKLGLERGIRSRNLEALELQMTEQQADHQQSRLEQLRQQQASLRQRLEILSGLRGGIDTRELFGAVDRALDEDVWFRSWNFRRAGELVDEPPEAVHTGYFIVLPEAGEKDRKRGWLLQTHMEIRAQAPDHSTLAGFVDRLLDDPRIASVRVLNTKTRRYLSSEAVDFELAIVVGGAG